MNYRTTVQPTLARTCCVLANTSLHGRRDITKSATMRGTLQASDFNVNSFSATPSTPLAMEDAVHLLGLLPRARHACAAGSS